jgi:hypothetical protein
VNDAYRADCSMVGGVYVDVGMFVCMHRPVWRMIGARCIVQGVEGMTCMSVCACVRCVRCVVYACRFARVCMQSNEEQ